MLTPGQDYSAKFLTSKGFKLISSPIQLKRGNLIFNDPLGNKWGIFKKWRIYSQTNSESR